MGRGAMLRAVAESGGSEGARGAPMIEYYLQQFKAAQATYGMRLLDYVDIHGYFAPDYPAGSGNSVGLGPAGDSVEQQVRLKLDAGAVGSDLHGCELPAAELHDGFELHVELLDAAAGAAGGSDAGVVGDEQLSRDEDGDRRI